MYDQSTHRKCLQDILDYRLSTFNGDIKLSLISVGIEFYFCIALMEKAETPKISHRVTYLLFQVISLCQNRLVFKKDEARSSTTLNVRQESEKK